MQPEVESRDDAEVAAAAAQRPEQLVVCLDHLAGRSDDLRPDEVVAGQAVLGRQVPDAATEREPSDAGRADDARRV